MSIVLWVLQILLGLQFFAIGVMHFFAPEELPSLEPTLRLISGTAEILGGLGLILPSITKIQPKLTPLAAAGLTLVMILAAFFHLSQGDFWLLPIVLVIGGLTAFVAYGRWKLRPIAAKSE